MEKHVRLLGILHLIWGGMGLFAILVVLILFVGGFTALGIANNDPAPFWLAGGFSTLFLGIVLLAVVPSIIAGYGLLKKYNWARILTIILSVIALFEFPLGTILGAYGLYVLLHGESSLIFSRYEESPVQTK